jgi:hypothetical protein
MHWVSSGSWAAAIAVAAVGAAAAPGGGSVTPYQAALQLSKGIGSRPAAAKGETRAQAYVARSFRSAGLQVSTDTFAVPGRGTSRNVVGVLDTPADCLQIFMGHVDGSPRGPGANDNASGVGVLVALASRLRSLAPKCDIWLSSNGAEERFYTHAPNHLGSAALVSRVQRLGIAKQLRFALDFDEVGRGGRFWLRSPQPGARRAVEGEVLAAARRAGVTVRWARDSGSGNSDHREFELAGLPAAVLESWRGIEPCRELACDRPSRLERRTLARALRIAVGVVRGG